MDKSQAKNVLPLIVLMACVLAPMFILASEVDGDEFIKASSGLALAAMVGAVMAAFKLWRSK